MALFAGLENLCQKADIPAKCGEKDVPLFRHHLFSIFIVLYNLLKYLGKNYGKTVAEKVGISIAS